MSQKFQYYDGPGDQNGTTYGGNWNGQVITIATTHVLTEVKLMIKKTAGATGTYYAEIRAENGAGKPTGAALSSGSVDIATALAEAYSLVTFNMTALELVSGTKYVIVNHCDAAVNCPWSRDSTGAYGGGTSVWSANGGTTWNIFAAMDYLFEEWGNLPAAGGGGGPAALLVGQGSI